ncbi:ATP-binding protein [Pedobacter frigoris]|uniref:ATP-binding protein n=1 Tax=Pedobacter frigoris TaxID=2571272 RepID=UPI00292D630E|nr:ATP-binding protein [Pedobacter frigoris]
MSQSIREDNKTEFKSRFSGVDIELSTIETSWDSYPAHGITLADLDFKKIERFIEKVNETGRFVLEGSVLESLEKLSLIKGQLVTNAAWLLFNKEGTGYNIYLGRFKTPSHIIDDKMHNGTLFDMVETIMRYLISQIKVAFEIKGMPTQRTEIFEYPLPALREMAINCLIHRNYLSPIDVQICLFDNYVEFYNPGGLAGSLTVEDLKRDDYKAHARNKLIAEAFYLTGDIEKYGSGFLRIRKEILTYPTMKLEFREAPNGFLNKLSYRDQKIFTKPVE